ncbi:MAG: hypothetical protein QOD47_2756 [Gemmatimonadaceae bacterium]|jgi:hypothetical protein|nr:hypothetical protein [Gemmatimonadaceae bacterium]
MTSENNFAGADTNALKARLSAAAARVDLAPAELRALVCALVDRMKSEGAPPEKVLIAVKNAFNDASTANHPSREALAESARTLSEAVTWCIEQYYTVEDSSRNELRNG